MAKIIISRDGQVERHVRLDKEKMTLGRHPHNDIVLTHPAVSGEHAVIVTILDDSFLEDLRSTNGTFVNGHRIGKHFLQPRDMLKIARFQIEFIADGVRPLAAAAMAQAAAALPVASVASATSAGIEVLNGANAGKRMTLHKPSSTLGRPGVLVVVIQRQGDTYTIAQVEGGVAPLVNDLPIAPGVAQRLLHGDVIELSGTRMAFYLS